jgi:GntR family transcriptional regulator, transcriptional repressor for pyruvate dehydrogenase complex
MAGQASAPAKMPVLLAEAIADGIVSRGLRPGDRLATEAEMIAQYEVGRATLREALRVLEAQGLIEVRVGAGGGPFVARPDIHRLARLLSLLLRMSDVTLREVLDARLIIEPALAQQAAQRRQDRHVTALRANQAALERAARGSTDWLRVNEEFHTLIAEASGNRPLAALWSALAAIADGHEAGVRYTAAAIGGMIAAHRKLVEAISAGDSAEASRVMTVHLEGTQSYIARYYPGLIDNPVTLVSGLAR